MPKLAGTRGLEGPSTRISNLCFQVGRSRAPLLFILWHIHVCSDSTENKCLNSSVAGSPVALCEVNLLGRMDGAPHLLSSAFTEYLLLRMESVLVNSDIY